MNDGLMNDGLMNDGLMNDGLMNDGLMNDGLMNDPHTESHDEDEDEKDSCHAPDTEVRFQHRGEPLPVGKQPDTYGGKEDNRYGIAQCPSTEPHQQGIIECQRDTHSDKPEGTLPAS